MAGNLDALKQGYQAFAQGDVQGATRIWSDDFTWQGANADELPGSGTHQGKDAALQVLQQAVGAWDEFRLTPDEFLEEGDTIVVLGHTEVSKAGQSAKIPVVHIWRFDGEQATRLQILTDTLQAARLLGVA